MRRLDAIVGSERKAMLVETLRDIVDGLAEERARMEPKP